MYCNSSLIWPQLFKGWITQLVLIELIHSKVIYLVHRNIHLLNNKGVELKENHIK